MSGVYISSGLLLLLVVIAGLLEFYDCNNKGNIMEVETKYSIMSGCFVKSKQGWVPLKNFRVLD